MSPRGSGGLGGGENSGIRGSSPEEAADSPGRQSHSTAQTGLRRLELVHQSCPRSTEAPVFQDKRAKRLPQRRPSDLCIELRLLPPAEAGPSPGFGGHSRIENWQPGREPPWDTESFCPLASVPFLSLGQRTAR